MFRVGEDDRRPGGGFPIGSTVQHGTLGAGRVVSVTGTGKDMKVLVDFGPIGQKTVFARFLAGGDDGLN